MAFNPKAPWGWLKMEQALTMRFIVCGSPQGQSSDDVQEGLCFPPPGIEATEPDPDSMCEGAAQQPVRF